NETDTLSSVDDGVPQIPEVAQHAARTPPSRKFEGHDCKVVFDQLCCACHGLSILATGRKGGQERSVLFDVGPYPDVWLDNSRRLGVNLSAIECVLLSHWHFDHSGGFPAVISAIARARCAENLPLPVVDLHPDRPDQRGVLAPSGLMLMLPEEPTLSEISQAGAKIATHRHPHAICDGFFFASGEIDRRTDYEEGLTGHHSFRGNDAQPDPLIMDERFIAACVKGRGVTVLSACSHAGIVNACLGAKQHFPDTPVDVVLGGYHLAGKTMETRIEPTVRDLERQIQPRLVAPGHCTGWRAKARLADAFAPGRYAPSVVGTLYRLSAP
ncbi:MAG: MBL fold metallo-hydrolase, partial [Gammaproteobacteria bacterium]|nr:MBL fold metallo-hydrolase [Gammaproteobacteria bacterium]NIR85975.1 MBL fold metallo-hydrolase [Gammaproteobacteria bacterium]NIR91966.1 MBL fold metallo-hydrolase [Gammaproteobacteria bacterium]NIU07216.1 MBL fold metallo-hydrolase [Gammaproteobacteria bacterium]NIV54019.1 MBL fold metallo-hydrolase [Gammaproteobacteria bacterium]